GSHGVVVDLGDGRDVLHTGGDEEDLLGVPDTADATVERSEVVEGVAELGVAVATEEVARAMERAIPRRLDVVGRSRGDVRAATSRCSVCTSRARRLPA